MKIVKKFQPKIVIFTAVKNQCMLHGRVFVMNHHFELFRVRVRVAVAGVRAFLICFINFLDLKLRNRHPPVFMTGFIRTGTS